MIGGLWKLDELVIYLTRYDVQGLLGGSLT